MTYTVSNEWFKKGMEAAHKSEWWNRQPSWKELGIKTEHEWKSWRAGYLPYRLGVSAGKKDGGIGVPMGDCPFKNSIQISEWGLGYEHGQ
jgi:hypothetical protein